MYIAAGAVMALYLFLLIVSRKEKTGQKGVLKIFYRMAQWIYRHVNVRKFSVFADKQVAKDLIRLHPQGNREELCAEYYVKKIAMFLSICVAGTFLGVILSINAKKTQMLKEEKGILRNSYMEASQEIRVRTASERQPFLVTVEAEKLTEEEAEILYRSFWQEVQQEILGNNASLQEVRESLHLVDTLNGYPFFIKWESDMPDVINSLGELQEIEEEISVLLRADVSYEDMEWREEIEVRLMPEILSEEHLHRKKLQELLEQSEQESRTESVWKLPDTYQGEKLVWEQVMKDDSLLLWGGMLIVAVAIYFLSDKDLHDTLEKQKEQMKREYPDIVQKFVLYMGAGMTIRGAFQKIATDYEHDSAQGERRRPAYEEMLYACRELQAGISETAVYEHFGRRTGLQEYIRLCTLLQQNLKKGSSTLLTRLREEADRAVLEKVQAGRRRGEEASTKLLLPMVMMLLVVMVIIMVPAFSSTVM
ncbi:MAG: hypothetical protein NC094_05515 [Bacteroidales bacterium]|nr:hypothetical protein [Lachnoclostridium sp.]MCM1384195.1 hypothetical protein [Lachnoclostridium sp.]MCM1464861.1 hypothetical protein [Bacteroidales bacterium]